MREILFRGKRKSDGELILGNLLQTDDDGICIIQNHIPHHLLKNYEVVPETVCQYTGLTDKTRSNITKPKQLFAGFIRAKWDCSIFLPMNLLQIGVRLSATFMTTLRL